MVDKIKLSICIIGVLLIIIGSYFLFADSINGNLNVVLICIGLLFTTIYTFNIVAVPFFLGVLYFIGVYIYYNPGVLIIIGILVIGGIYIYIQKLKDNHQIELKKNMQLIDENEQLKNEVIKKKITKKSKKIL